MRITEHFRSEEFRCHDGTAVPTYALDDLRRLCAGFLEPLRSMYGPVTIISGYRTLTHNRAVGGAPRSMHVYTRERRGAAADVTCRRGDPALWYRALDLMDVPGLGRYENHVHADTRAGRARW